MQLFVRGLDGRTACVRVCEDATGADLKRALEVRRDGC